MEAGDDSEEEAEPVEPGRPNNGPWDVDDAPHDEVVRLDLGSIRIPGTAGMEIQVNLDEAAGSVVAVTVVLGDSTLQLQAFAAPRREGIWDEVRRELAAEITRDGGIADVEDIAVGPSLKAKLPFPQANGSTALSAVRFIGCDGPRWFLRGVLTGPAAADPVVAEPLLAVFSGTVVVRGNQAYAPREALPLHLPEGAAPDVDADGRPMDREPWTSAVRASRSRDPLTAANSEHGRMPGRGVNFCYDRGSGGYGGSATGTAEGKNVFRRALDRLTSTSEEMDARELLEESIERGSTPVGRCRSGEKVTVSGTIKALTLRPVGGVPALEAELYDGSGTLTLIWLGRRRIPGIDPGRSLSVHGRVTSQKGHRVMFNPAYELRT